MRLAIDELLAFVLEKQYICENEWSGSPTDSIPIIQLLDVLLSIFITH